MKKIYTFTLFILAFSWNIYAQVNQPSVGTGYANMTFYNVNDGATVSYPHTSWDIAFDVSLQGAGISINEGIESSSGPSPVFAFEAYLAASTDFESADTAGMARIYNDEVSWADGAFNLVKNEMDPFDLGWGSYDPTNHTISGTRIFIVRLRNAEYKKLEITLLASGVYTFRYANMDGSNEETHTITKSDYSGKTLAYFSIENGEALDLEPNAWDMVFTRYVTPLENGPSTIDYNVTGVLSNSGVEVAQADEIDPETVDHEDYADDYTTQLDEIGHDWKNFDLNTFQWEMVVDRVYFVKTSNQELWKLWFFDFEGSSTGITSIEKTFISDLVSVEDEFENLESFSIFPNPANDFVNVAFEIETTERAGILRLTNQLGQTVFENKTAIENGLNVKEIQFDLPTGIYYLSLQVQNEVINRPLIIK